MQRGIRSALDAEEELGEAQVAVLVGDFGQGVGARTASAALHRRGPADIRDLDGFKPSSVAQPRCHCAPERNPAAPPARTDSHKTAAAALPPVLFLIPHVHACVLLLTPQMLFGHAGNKHSSPASVCATGLSDIASEIVSRLVGCCTTPGGGPQQRYHHFANARFQRNAKVVARHNTRRQKPRAVLSSWCLNSA